MTLCATPGAAYGVSPPQAVGIGDGGSPNNACSGGLIPAEGVPCETGDALFVSAGRADGVDVGVAAGRDCLRCVGGRACRKCLAGVYDSDTLSSTSLDGYVSKTNYVQKPSLPESNGGWTRQQKRGYHRIQSCLTFWFSHGYQVLWLCLTTAVGGDAGRLAYNHQRLRQRVEQRLGYVGLEHFQIATREGNGVLHIFWAWRPRDGFRGRRFYVPQEWLSRWWLEIHGAPIVWVTAVRSGRRSRQRLSRYAMAQYVGGQGAYVRMSWSWQRTFGFPLVACWQWLKRGLGVGVPKAWLLHWWGVFLSGGHILGLRSPPALSLAMVRTWYRRVGVGVWAVELQPP